MIRKMNHLRRDLNDITAKRETATLVLVSDFVLAEMLVWSPRFYITQRYVLYHSIPKRKRNAVL